MEAQARGGKNENVLEEGFQGNWKSFLHKKSVQRFPEIMSEDSFWMRKDEWPYVSANRCA